MISTNHFYSTFIHFSVPSRSVRNHEQMIRFPRTIRLRDSVCISSPNDHFQCAGNDVGDFRLFGGYTWRQPYTQPCYPTLLNNSRLRFVRLKNNTPDLFRPSLNHPFLRYIHSYDTGFFLYGLPDPYN